jgi:3-polyprenyl-4-hydroxybenzoate decarboxylase
MTAEERAEVIAEMFERALLMVVSDSMRSALAVIIEGAEDEALERAAQIAYEERFNVEVKTSSPLMADAALVVARRIRALKSPRPVQSGGDLP